MPQIEVTTNIKGLREALREAQALQVFLPLNVRSEPYLMFLQTLINELDKHRPLGPDGKHGDRHTETCGCEDKPHGEWCFKGHPGSDDYYQCNHLLEGEEV